MMVSNNPIFSSQAAQNGAWRNISNFFGISIHITGLEGNVWVEVANDPNVLTNGATIAAPAAPVLSQYTPQVDSGLGYPGVPVNTTYYVKTTYVTPGGGETTPSTESSLLVTAGNILIVTSPAADAGAVATNWKCYVSTTSGTETLQGSKPIGQNLFVNAYSNSGVVVPTSNTSSSPGSGVNITGNLASGGYTSPAPTSTFNQIQVVINNGQAMINPSGVCWNYLRVCKDSTTNTKVSAATLFGQQG